MKTEAMNVVSRKHSFPDQGGLLLKLLLLLRLLAPGFPVQGAVPCSLPTPLAAVKGNGRLSWKHQDNGR